MDKIDKTENLKNIKNNLAKLKHLKLIEVDKEVLTLISTLKKIPGPLNQFQPIKIKRKYIRYLVASLLHASLTDLKDLIKDKETPCLWIMLIRLILKTIQHSNTQDMDWLLMYAFGEDAFGVKDTEVDTSEKKIIVLPDPDTYNEAEVLERQNKLKNLSTKDYEKLTE